MRHGGPTSHAQDDRPTEAPYAASVWYAPDATSGRSPVMTPLHPDSKIRPLFDGLADYMPITALSPFDGPHDR